MYGQHLLDPIEGASETVIKNTFNSNIKNHISSVGGNLSTALMPEI